MDNLKKEIKSTEPEFKNSKEMISQEKSENSDQTSKLNPDIEILSITPIEKMKIEEKISDSKLKNEKEIIRDENSNESNDSDNISKLNPELEELKISPKDILKIEKEIFIKERNKNQPL